MTYPFLKKSKIMTIQGHQSTGGGPKYALFLIDKFIKMGHEVKVIEWNNYSDEYAVQKNDILNLVGKDNFYTVGNLMEPEEVFYSKMPKVQDLIKDFSPDFIHLNDPSERFSIRGMNEDFCKFLYSKDRKWKIFETIHDSEFNLREKKNIPDELWLPSEWYLNQAENLPCLKRVVEFEIPEKNRPDRETALKKVGLNPEYFYCLQVGLFSDWKNQKWTFNLASNLTDRKIKFLFAGNTCFYDSLDLNKPENCILLNEISNVDDYYSAVDVLLLPSKKELNPICVKEGLSWKLPCWISELDTYKNKYINNPLVTFIKNNNLYEYLLQNSEPKDPTAKTESRPYFFVENQMLFSFNNSAKVEIVGNFDYNYLVQFIDQDTGAIAYQANIRNNMWSLCNPVYFVNWKIVVTNLVTKQVTEHKLDFKNKKISVINESGSLGDCLAWVNSVSRFATKHNIIVDYFTAKHDLFSGQYDNVRFYPYSDKDKNKDYYATYSLICDHEQNSKYCKKDWRKISLQNFPAEVLGLEYKEERAKINLPPTKKKKFEKYVCLATQSTLQNRYYNNKYGWRDIVRYLRQLGYKIVVIDKHMQFGSKESMNTVPEHDYFAGNDSFDDIINLVRNCDFVIGLSSGLSHLSWTLNKPIVVISGAVADWYEFSNPYRIQSKAECNSCFNRSKLDASDWLFCPDKKDFVCTKSITFEMVKEKIDQLVKDIS